MLGDGDDVNNVHGAAGGDDDDQGGRSCTGARVTPAEKFGLERKF